MTDKATIINMALTDLGPGPIFSTDDDSDLARKIELCWTRTVDQIFGMHDWSFARRTARLIQLAEQPQNGWQYGYELPGDRLGAPKKYTAAFDSTNPIRNFSVAAGVMYCNDAQVWATYWTALDPDSWDPPFRSAFVIALSGYLAVPMIANEDTRDRKLAEAFGTPSKEGTGGLIGRLLAQDKAAQPVGEPLMKEDPLTRVRPAGASIHDLPWYGRTS